MTGGKWENICYIFARVRVRINQIFSYGLKIARVSSKMGKNARRINRRKGISVSFENVVFGEGD